MKICLKCGACNSDARRLCIDCGETLGDKLSDFQEKQYRRNISAQIEKMYNKKDPLYVSLFDKIVGVFSIIGVVGTIALIVINLIIQKSVEGLGWAIVFFVLSSLDAFVPKFTWTLEQHRLGFYINGAEDTEPSVFYLWSRRISIVLLALLGLAVVITVVLQ